MTSKKPSNPPKKWDVQFVNCNLDKSTKEQVKKWDVKYEATLDGLDRMIRDGYKISVSYDSYNDCIGVFATQKQEDHPSFGLCLSARGPGLLDAWKVLVFKHFQILDGVWGTIVDQKGQRDDWG